MKRVVAASSETALLVCLLAGTGSTACGLGVEATPMPPPITNAHVLFAGGDRPPEDSAPWQAQRLPDDWSRTRPHLSGDAWYRVEFTLRPEDVRLHAIYVPRVSMVAAPYVNGARLADPGRFSEPMTRLWYRPQLYWVPRELLHPGTNVFHYRIRTYPDNQGGVSEIYVGPPAALEARWRRHVFRQVTAMQVTTGVTAALGVLVIVAWAVLGRYSTYGYFGLAAMFWTLHSTLVLATEIPIPVLYWETLIVASLMWVVVALMMFALRFAGLRRPWLERAAWAYAVAAPVLLWAAGSGRIFGVGNALLFVLIAIGAYELKILVDVARRSRSLESRILVGAAVFVLGLGSSDWLNRHGVWAYAAPFNMHYGVPVLFVAVFANLMGQVAAGRRAVETANIELETRVRAKAEALERSYEQLRVAHAAETLAAERERIMRDMHDGVGSQLIAARQMAARRSLDTRQLVAVLDECIDDLRLVIDSLEPAGGDLLTVIGNLRYRLTERLAPQGIVVRWEVRDTPAVPTLPPQATLQVLRVVQEAVANVLKHTRATEVVLSIGTTADRRHVELQVRDNGQGFAPDGLPSAGHGLSNMRNRVEALGGALTIDSRPEGCTVTLTLPAGEGPSPV